MTAPDQEPRPVGRVKRFTKEEIRQWEAANTRPPPTVGRKALAYWIGRRNIRTRKPGPP